MTQNQKVLKATEQEMARLADQIKKVWDKAEEEERETSSDERGEVEDHLKQIEVLRTKKADVEKAIETEDNVARISREMGPADGIATTNGKGVELQDGIDSIRGNFQVKSIGEQFIESEPYKGLVERVKSNGGVPQNASTGPVQVKAGTLLEGAQGAGLIPVPQVVPGQVETLFQRLTIADVLPTGQVSVNSLRVTVEGTASSGAAAVSEGGVKPASNLALSTVDEPVQKIATVLTISDEIALSQSRNLAKCWKVRSIRRYSPQGSDNATGADNQQERPVAMAGILRD